MISFIPNFDQLVIRREGPRILVLYRGRRLMDVNWRTADAIAKSLLAKAREAEELEKADDVARDHAILLRAGFPVGLTRHPKIQDEAVKIAAWNRDLRRYMPGGIKSQEQLGTPSVIVKPPRRVA